MFLPTTIAEGKAYYKNFTEFDVVIISGDPYYDHPLSGTALIARLLDKKGWKVGIIPQPEQEHEYKACGSPKFFYCITSGLLDSMLANYTPMLRKRDNVLVPERALITYTQEIKKLDRGCKTVLGGVEATIRRFTHFDYKENALRRGILNDSKADYLLHGNAERSILSLLHLLQKTKVPSTQAILDIEGIAFRIKKSEIPSHTIRLPSFESCTEDKYKFNLLSRIIHLIPEKNYVEPCGKGYVMHTRPAHTLTEKEMDFIYDVPFTRRLHQGTKNLENTQDMVSFLQSSVPIARGCWGSCNFCIIPLVQGKEIAKRSVKSITNEIETLYKNGVTKINDLTMPTLNMYGSKCKLFNIKKKIFSTIIEEEITVYDKSAYCNQECAGCSERVLSDQLIKLLEEIAKLNNTYSASLELRSAIRHDVILEQTELFETIMKFTTRLKIAPEHVADQVLKQMNKADQKAFKKFLKLYDQTNKKQGTQKNLVPYWVVAHPGTSDKEMKLLHEFCKENGLFTNLTQVFTPTPGTLSTAMYFTGRHPLSNKEVYVPRTFKEKKVQKNMMTASETSGNDVTG
ncbi:YgiQ family radical SAM protein [Candidatus Woesearchaeota archaeon]|nr:YgiQ family radical SAM protein [Candidatus Woesearchaeota archaeon]